MPKFADLWNAQGVKESMDHSLKVEAVLHYAEQSGAKCFVETGTYLGGMILAVAHHFDKCVTIEVSPEVHKVFVDSAGVLPKNVQSLVGKSYELLPGVIAMLDGARLFWLDAHGSTWGEQFGGNKQEVPECSVLDELDIVMSNKHDGDIVLIDDAHLFGTCGWSSVDEIRQRLKKYGMTVRQEALILVVEPE